MNSNKYIGLNQRVPFDVLDAGLFRFLRDGTIDKELIISHLREFTKGENRVLKAAQHGIQILTKHKQCILELEKSIGAEGYLKLPLTDRKAILLALVALTYPLTYDLLVALGSGFKVQSQISKHFINLKMAALYGSNRSINNGLDAVLPMIIELGTIERVKMGIYALAQKSIITYPIIRELLVYTDIKSSGSKSILVEDLQHRPWYMFFEIDLGNKHDFSLFKYAESRVGMGYLTIEPSPGSIQSR